MIDVSVIIPVYNIPNKMLYDCIESLRNQTLKGIEFIFVDDCSPDQENISLIKKYVNDDARIKLIRHDCNRGVSAARNSGIDVSKGRYIGFVDADDVVAPDMYETMLLTADKDNVDIVICSTRYGQKNGTFVEIRQGNRILDIDRNGRMSFFYNTGLGTCDKLINKDVIGSLRFNTNSSHNEDYLFNWELMAKVKRVRFMNDIFYSALWRDGSASRSVMSSRKFISTFNSLSGMTKVADRLWNQGECRLAKYLYYKLLLIGPANISLFSYPKSDYSEAKATYQGFLKNDFDKAKSRLTIVVRIGLRLYSPLRSGGQSGLSHKIVRLILLYKYNRVSGKGILKSMKDILSSHI